MTTSAASDRTEVGNYFVANYPPFSVVDARKRVETTPGRRWRRRRRDVPLGLYLHIPFCRKRCHFCYFRVYTDKNARRCRAISTCWRANGSCTTSSRRSPAGRSTSSTSAAARRPISRRAQLEALVSRMDAVSSWRIGRGDHLRVRAGHAHREQAARDPRHRRDAAQPRPGYARLEVGGRRPARADLETLRSQVAHILRLDQDLTPFYEVADKDPDLSWVTCGSRADCCGARRSSRRSSRRSARRTAPGRRPCAWSRALVEKPRRAGDRGGMAVRASLSNSGGHGPKDQCVFTVTPSERAIEARTSERCRLIGLLRAGSTWSLSRARVRKELPGPGSFGPRFSLSPGCWTLRCRAHHDARRPLHPARPRLVDTTLSTLESVRCESGRRTRRSSGASDATGRMPAWPSGYLSL